MKFLVLSPSSWKAQIHYITPVVTVQRLPWSSRCSDTSGTPLDHASSDLPLDSQREKGGRSECRWEAHWPLAMAVPSLRYWCVTGAHWENLEGKKMSLRAFLELRNSPPCYMPHQCHTWDWQKRCVCAFPELRPTQLPGAGGWRRCGERRIPEGRLGGCGARAQAMAHDVKGQR